MKTILIMFALFLSWPSSEALAQKVVSEQNVETNGAEKYSSSQSKTSANYSTLRDRNEMNHVRSRANATTNGLGKQIQNRMQEAKASQDRERVHKEQESKKDANSSSDKKDSGSDKKDSSSDKKDSGSDKKDAGSDKKDAGSDKKDAGSDKKDAGSDKKTAN